MSDARKDVRVQLVISRAELNRLDTWRTERQIWSRSAAIRRLIAQGIGGDGGLIWRTGLTPASLFQIL
jgi:hypothetical protein